ncbi:unnamed protein product [Rangifer tarandus platyrhynchus]|uniref:Uncharacterized protein n=1 Tax=Rangifer tarandus platyrhynchus TaxID=3082113 RepID=A0AC59YWD9_RANTA
MHSVCPRSCEIRFPGGPLLLSQRKLRSGQQPLSSRSASPGPPDTRHCRKLATGHGRHLPPAPPSSRQARPVHVLTQPALSPPPGAGEPGHNAKALLQLLPGAAMACSRSAAVSRASAPCGELQGAAALAGCVTLL